MHTNNDLTQAAEKTDGRLAGAPLLRPGSTDFDSIASAAPDQYVISGSLFDRLLRAAWQNQLDRCKR